MTSERCSDENIARMKETTQILVLRLDLDSLTQKLSDPDHLVRKLAALKMQWLEDARAVEPLLKAMEDEHPGVRAGAAQSLGRYNDPASFTAILDHLAHDPSPGVRRVCAHAARSSDADATMECLERALKDPDELVRLSACWYFVHKHDSRALSAICDLLNNADTVLCYGAATALIRLGIEGERVMDMLQNDAAWMVRREIADELIRAGVADQRIVDAIERLMREPEAQKYEANIDEYRASLGSEDEELSEEDMETIREIEDSGPRPLSEMLAKARALLEQ